MLIPPWLTSKRNKSWIEFEFNQETGFWQTRDSSNVRLTTGSALVFKEHVSKYSASHLLARTSWRATNSLEARELREDFSDTSPSLFRSTSYRVVTYPPPRAKKFLHRATRIDLFPLRRLCLIHGCILLRRSGQGHCSVSTSESAMASSKAWLHKWTRRLMTRLNNLSSPISGRIRNNVIMRMPTSICATTSVKVEARVLNLATVNN